MWRSGELQLKHGSDRFSLRTPERRIEFHCGDPMDIRLDGRWQRGRVEWSPRLGHYWTDNQVNRRILTGGEVRVWDGGIWPQREESRGHLDR